MTTGKLLALFGGLVVALGLITAASPVPDRETDRSIYEATAEHGIVPGCGDIHCFRVLVAWTLGVVPGPSQVKWKAFAAVANAAGAVGVFVLCLAWGLSSRAAWLAAMLSAFGFGSLYTLFDPYTSDPLMYALGPWLVWLLLRDRVALAAAIAAVGVLAKEFAAAPMLVFAGATALTGQRVAALRVMAAGSVALIVWLVLQFSLVIGFSYGYANNPSTRLLSGGYLRAWLEAQSWQAAAAAMYGEFGMLWLLAPAGLLLAPVAVFRFALASVPVALVFGYVQQPDRAFWNFHFVVAALAALVLEKAPPVIAWSAVVAFAIANLRLGAQLPFVPPSRMALAVSAGLAIACVCLVRRQITAAMSPAGLAA